jgi:hypothetical protein
MINPVTDIIKYLMIRSGSDAQMNKAGKIARDFLIAIGATEVQISSLLISNIPQMAYKITKKFEELDFGEFKDQIQRPKY